MASIEIEQLYDRIERLLSHHEALKNAHVQLEEELAQVTRERDRLKAVLAVVQQKVSALNQRLPQEHRLAIFAESSKKSGN